MPNETVRTNKPHFNNFIAIPRIAKEELDPYEFKLYSHYVDETQWSRPYKRGRRGTSQDSGVCERNLIATRDSLAAKGYITVTPATRPDLPDEVVVQQEIWQRNAEKYGSRQVQLEYVLDFLASGLSPDELQQVATLVQNCSGGGANLPQAGAETPQGWGKSAPDSYIDESQIDSSTGAERTRGQNACLKGGKDRRYDSPGYSSNGLATQGALQKAILTLPPVTPMILEEHPLVMLLREKTGNRRPLTKAEIDYLTGKLTINNARGPQSVYRGGLTDVADVEPGFLAFAGIRADMFLNSPKISNKTMKDILANLTKLDFVPPEGTQKWPGFYAWRDQHPELCQLVTETAAPVEEKPDPAWKGVKPHVDYSERSVEDLEWLEPGDYSDIE